MSNHTPGPWVAKTIDHGVRIEPSIAWMGFGSAHPRETHVANANLIAAAPDLLSALKAAKAFIEIYKADFSDTILATIQSAINKANTP